MQGRKGFIFFLVLVILMCALFFVTGCSDQAPAADSGAEDADSTLKDELILAVGYENDEGWDPVTGWGRYGSPLFQSTLFKRDSNLAVISDLATGYEVSDDALTWTVTIRDDAVFSDGEKLTASDVAFTFRQTKESGSVVDLSVLAEVKALDDYTVEFNLERPHSAFISILVSTGIVPEHAYESNYAENPVGSGPFMLLQWDKGQQLIVEANPLYYGKQPYFKRITFLFLEEDAAFAAAKAGEVQIAAIPHAFGDQKVPGMRLENLESIDNRGIMFPFVKTGGETEDGKPIGNDVTADPAIRRAINVAADRQALVTGALNNFGTPAYSVCDNMPWWNPETVQDDADFETAAAILAEAGWADSDGDGILEKEGLKASFSLLYPASDMTRQALALGVADMIKPLGIEIKAEGKSWDDIQQLMYSEAVLFGWGSYDPIEMFNLYHSSMAGFSWYNTGYYSNPVVDQYMEQALSATSEDEANSYWKKAQWDGETGFSGLGDAPWAWLVNLGHLYMVDENLDIGRQKIQPHGHGWPITDTIAEWKWQQ
jgi:peptide/nickel transport system substrate-binding protein